MIWAKNEFIIFVTLTRLDKRLANDCGGEKQKMEEYYFNKFVNDDDVSVAHGYKTLEDI